MVGDVPVFPVIDAGGVSPLRCTQLGNALALNPTGVDVVELTVRFCAGGAELLFAATQKLRLVGLTVIVLVWAIAVSR